MAWIGILVFASLPSVLPELTACILSGRYFSRVLVQSLPKEKSVVYITVLSMVAGLRTENGVKLSVPGDKGEFTVPRE